MATKTKKVKNQEYLEAQYGVTVAFREYKKAQNKSISLNKKAVEKKQAVLKALQEITKLQEKSDTAVAELDEAQSAAQSAKDVYEQAKSNLKQIPEWIVED